MPRSSVIRLSLSPEGSFVPDHRKKVLSKRPRTALPGNQKKRNERGVDLTGLKEAGARLVCLSPNTNFLSDTVHFCYPCPQPEKKLHHFSSPLCHLRTRSVPLVPSSVLHVGFAYSSETSQRGPQDRMAFTDFHQTKGSSHKICGIQGRRGRQAPPI